MELGREGLSKQCPRGDRAEGPARRPLCQSPVRGSRTGPSWRTRPRSNRRLADAMSFSHANRTRCDRRHACSRFGTTRRLPPDVLYDGVDRSGRQGGRERGGGRVSRDCYSGQCVRVASSWPVRPAQANAVAPYRPGLLRAGSEADPRGRKKQRKRAPKTGQGSPGPPPRMSPPLPGRHDHPSRAPIPATTRCDRSTPARPPPLASREKQGQRTRGG